MNYKWSQNIIDYNCEFKMKFMVIKITLEMK